MYLIVKIINLEIVVIKINVKIVFHLVIFVVARLPVFLVNHIITYQELLVQLVVLLEHGKMLLHGNAKLALNQIV